MQSASEGACESVEKCLRSVSHSSTCESVEECLRSVSHSCTGNKVLGLVVLCGGRATLGSISTRRGYRRSARPLQHEPQSMQQQRSATVTAAIDTSMLSLDRGIHIIVHPVANLERKDRSRAQ